jgi:serine/threonine-protein kinase
MPGEANDFMSDPYIGKKLGNYDISEMIGKGGMAAVYRAHQPSMNRTVAIKVMSQQFSGDDAFIQRFKNEAQLIAHLEHAHILPVYEFGEQEGSLYIVMRFLNAGTLEDRIKPGGMDMKDILAVFGQLASALDYAHENGVIHRDLKPSNVLIDAQGNAFLSDFGIAKTVENAQNLTGTGGVVGTPTYMSPEQGLGSAIDARSDIYALGVILFEMLVGEPPFTGDNPMQVMLKHINELPPSLTSLNPKVNPAVESVVMKALDKEPTRRFSSSKELSDALKEAATKGTMVSMPAASYGDENTMPIASAGGAAGASTMRSPISGQASPTTAPPGQMAPAVQAPPMPGVATGVGEVVVETPYYEISDASKWLVDHPAIGQWIQAVGLTGATFFALQRLTPGEVGQNMVLSLIPGVVTYGLLNAGVPGGLIALGLLVPPLMANSPVLGILWLMMLAIAGMQMTSREMMLVMVSMIGAGTPLGWVIPLAAPWWMRNHRVAFGAAVGVIFAALFALLIGWPSGGNLMPTIEDRSRFENLQIGTFETSYLGLLEPDVWKAYFETPGKILDGIRQGLQILGEFFFQVKALPLIVALAWAGASLVSTLNRKDPSFWMRGVGIGVGGLILIIGHLFHGWAGATPPTTVAFVLGLIMVGLAFGLTQYPIQAPPPPRKKSK